VRLGKFTGRGSRIARHVKRRVDDLQVWPVSFAFDPRSGNQRI
jgi:hypothetical protein